MGLFGPSNVDKMKTRRDVEGLIKALGDQKHYNVRRFVASALRQIGDARGIAALSAALKDSDFEYHDPWEGAP